MLKHTRKQLMMGLGAWLGLAVLSVQASPSEPLAVASDHVVPSFTMLDNNGDGFVSRREAVVADAEIFATADDNDDGRLDRGEFTVLLAQLAQRLQNEEELSKELLMHSVAVDHRWPFVGSRLGVID